MSFSKLSALSSMTSFPSTLVLNPLFLASVTILSISLNLSSLTFIHFGNIYLPGFVLIPNALNKY